MSSAASNPAEPSGVVLATGDLEALFVRWHLHADQTAREALVEHFLPLARRLAHRYSGSSEPFEDLLQVASVGLLEAIDRFDPERGTSFTSFAVPTILGAMRRDFRDSGWSVHVPRRTQEQALKVRSAQERFANERGYAPTVGQLAEYLELDTEEIIDALLAAEAYQPMSLDAPLPAGENDSGITYGEALGGEDKRFTLLESDEAVVTALGHLPRRDRRLLHLRFVEELSQAEIATRVGVSQMQVSRLLRQALSKLRTLVVGPPRINR